MTSGLALLLSVVYSLAPLVNNLDPINKFNPFEWALAGRILFEGGQISNEVKLVLLSLALYLATIWVIKRKDIRTQ